MSFLFIKPVTEEHKRKPFFARIVAPEDAGLKREVIAPTKIVTAPKSVQQVKPAHLAPSITKKAPRTLFSEQSVPPVPKRGGHENISPLSPGIDDAKTPQEEGYSGGVPSVAITPSKKSFSVGRSIKEGGEEYAKKTEDQQQKSTVTFDAKEFKYYGYMQRLKEKIEGIWQYPSDAAKRGIYGDLYISFTIKKNGTLGSVELVRTSGYKDLDDAAIKALKEAAPFWPLPEDWKKEGLTITGHFVYTLYGAFIR